MVIGIGFFVAFMLSMFLFSHSYSFIKNFFRLAVASASLNSFLFILYWIVESWEIAIFDMPVLASIVTGIMLFLMFIMWLSDGS